MSRSLSLLALAALAVGGAAVAQQSSASDANTQAGSSSATICQYVVSSEPGAKPERLCLSKAEWDAKKLADSRDATRIVCRYQELAGSRFRSAKVCMPASQWDEQRRLEREAVETIQRNVCVAGAGC